MTEAAVRCEGLVKRYPDIVAVNGLDLEVRRGECLGLLGPNGAGKTTAVEMIEGLTTPDEGIIEIFGQRWSRRGSRQLRERLGVQLQQVDLVDRLTVVETVRLFRSFFSKGRRASEVIDLVGLQPKRDAWVSKLSGGQRQRLALACALVGAPDLLCLDEPTTGLDPQARRRIWEIVETFRNGGGTVLLTTHYMEEADTLCDRVAIMDAGKIIALGTPQALIERLGAARVIEVAVDGQADKRRLKGIAGIHAVREADGRLKLAVDDIAGVMTPLLAELERQGLPPTSLNTHLATLEDVFMDLTGKELRDE